MRFGNKQGQLPQISERIPILSQCEKIPPIKIANALEKLFKNSIKFTAYFFLSLSVHISFIMILLIVGIALISPNKNLTKHAHTKLCAIPKSTENIVIDIRAQTIPVFRPLRSINQPQKGVPIHLPMKNIAIRIPQQIPTSERDKDL